MVFIGCSNRYGIGDGYGDLGRKRYSNDHGDLRIGEHQRLDHDHSMGIDQWG